MCVWGGSIVGERLSTHLQALEELYKGGRGGGRYEEGVREERRERRRGEEGRMREKRVREG